MQFRNIEGLAAKHKRQFANVSKIASTTASEFERILQNSPIVCEECGHHVVELVAVNGNELSIKPRCNHKDAEIQSVKLQAYQSAMSALGLK